MARWICEKAQKKYYVLRFLLKEAKDELLRISRGSLFHIVVWPSMSCFADWSKCHHVTFIIIEWAMHHGRPCIIIDWYTVAVYQSIMIHRYVTMHHCKLALLMNVNTRCITTVLIIKKATVSKSQNVKDSSRANKCLRKIKINLRTKVEICISTYSNADAICYSTTSQTKLNKCNSVCLIVDRS